MSKKTSKQGRRSAWISKELLTKPKQIKHSNKHNKSETGLFEDYRLSLKIGKTA